MGMLGPSPSEVVALLKTGPLVGEKNNGVARFGKFVR